MTGTETEHTVLFGPFRPGMRTGLNIIQSALI